jgi:uncharacterized RDD family membrane protein YckC
MAPPGTGARCAQHEESPAAIICSRCGSYACTTCRQWGPDGADYCATCTFFQPELADRGSRFVAFLVDYLLVVGPVLVATILGLVTMETEGAESFLGLMFCMGTLVTLGLGVVQLFLVNQSGQSIGKRMLGIRVVRADGSPASLGRIIFLRNVIPLAVNSMCGIFKFIDAVFIFNEDHCCLHDKMADTIVVKVDGTTGMR